MKGKRYFTLLDDPNELGLHELGHEYQFNPLFEPRLVHRQLQDLAERMPDRIWLEFVDDGSYSYDDIWKSVNAVAEGMKRAGVTAGDRVGIMLDNCVEFVEIWFACHLLGAISAPLNTATRGATLRHHLELAAPTMVFSEEKYSEVVGREIANASVQGGFDIESLVVIEGSGLSRDNSNRSDVPERNRVASQLGEAQRVFDYASLKEPLSERVSEQQGITPLDSAWIAFTSGTTGPSKGIIWTHNYTLYMAEASAYHMEYGPEEVVYTCLPLFHVNGLIMQLFAALLAEAKVVVAKRFSVTNYWRHINQYEITSTNFLGSMIPLLLDKPESLEENSHRLRKALVIPCGEEYYRMLPERFGFQPYEGYGLADYGMLTWTPLGVEPKPGSIGKSDPGFECKIVDEYDVETPRGIPGEMVARARLPWIASPGYWNDASTTVKTWRNLWFHTGDKCSMDSDGWFYFWDRTKDAIRRRGENISSFEVEQAILSHEAVIECAAYALPSEFKEDDVGVAIVVKPNSNVSPEELLDRAECDLPYFAVPRYVRFVNEIPKTANGKARKAAFRQDGITADTWDREATDYKIRR